MYSKIIVSIHNQNRRICNLAHKHMKARGEEEGHFLKAHDLGQGSFDSESNRTENRLINNRVFHSRSCQAIGPYSPSIHNSAYMGLQQAISLREKTGVMFLELVCLGKNKFSEMMLGPQIINFILDLQGRVRSNHIFTSFLHIHYKACLQVSQLSHVPPTASQSYD